MSFRLNENLPYNSSIKPVFNAGKVNNVPVSFQVLNGLFIDGNNGTGPFALNVTNGNYCYVGSGPVGSEFSITLPSNPPVGYYIFISRENEDFDIRYIAPTGTILSDGEGGYVREDTLSDSTGRNILTQQLLLSAQIHDGENVWVNIGETY